jgi:hypothetical protein
MGVHEVRLAGAQMRPHEPQRAEVRDPPPADEDGLHARRAYTLGRWASIDLVQVPDGEIDSRRGRSDGEVPLQHLRPTPRQRIDQRVYPQSAPGHASDGLLRGVTGTGPGLIHAYPQAFAAEHTRQRQRVVVRPVEHEESAEAGHPALEGFQMHGVSHWS